MQKSNERIETTEKHKIILGSESFSYTMVRRQTGKKVQWFPTCEGKRFTKTLFSAKWEAERLVKDLVRFHGIQKLKSFFN